MSHDSCSPGSHPHADQPNWQPADTVQAYIDNCREGLENYSERRLAKLLGVSRTWLWRAKMVAEIPNDLLEFILEHAPNENISISSKALAQVGAAFYRGGNGVAEVERCPHCGEVLRVRTLVSDKMVDLVNRWLAKQQEPLE
jgi:hypothetical protein